jgi:hypothetical protein
LSLKKASLLKSLRYFQQMYWVEVETRLTERFSLPDFKNVINEHVRLHKKYWIKKDIIRDLQQSILKMNDYNQIIQYLK